MPLHFDSFGDFGAASIGLEGIQIAKAAIKAINVLRIILSSYVDPRLTDPDVRIREMPRAKPRSMAWFVF